MRIPSFRLVISSSSVADAASASSHRISRSEKAPQKGWLPVGQGGGDNQWPIFDTVIGYIDESFDRNPLPHPLPCCCFAPGSLFGACTPPTMENVEIPHVAALAHLSYPIGSLFPSFQNGDDSFRQMRFSFPSTSLYSSAGPPSGARNTFPITGP